MLDFNILEKLLSHYLVLNSYDELKKLVFILFIRFENKMT